ncbi:F-box protein [Spatholobus suberectus]|nr:F-box protein [Spatholobus suberectus]
MPSYPPISNTLSNPTLSLSLISHSRDYREQGSLCSPTTHGLRTTAKLRYSFESFPIRGRLLYFHPVSTINGVICLSDYTDFVILWNPFIQKRSQLPISMYTFRKLCHPYMFFVGFGFDSKRNDFKVVRIVYHEGWDTRVFVAPRLVELYSLNEGAWRTIDAYASPRGVMRICYHEGWNAPGVAPRLVELYSLNEGAWRTIDAYASFMDVRIVERM